MEREYVGLITSDDLWMVEVGLWAERKNLTLSKLTQVTGMMIKILSICLALICKWHYDEQPHG